MKCPSCGSTRTKVVDSRPGCEEAGARVARLFGDPDAVRIRRRVCTPCHRVFLTAETALNVSCGRGGKGDQERPAEPERARGPEGDTLTSRGVTLLVAIHRPKESSNV